MGWSQSQAAWSFVAGASVAWAGLTLARSRVAELNTVLLGTALAATSVAVAAARGHPAQSSMLVAISTGGSVVACYGVRRWPLAYIPAIGSATSLGFLWRYTGWDVWALALTYTGLSAGTAVALMALRDWKDGERSIVVSLLSTAPRTLAGGTVAIALNARSRDLVGSETIATTPEWASLVVVVLLAGVLLLWEGLRLHRKAVSVAATLLLLLSLELGVAMLEPSTRQAYTTPLGCYVMGAALYIRRSPGLFGTHMEQHEALLFVGEAVVIVPGTRDALAWGNIGWSLLLIGEGMVLLSTGFVLAQRWLGVGGVLTLVGVAGRFYTAGGYQPPYWLTLAIVGMLLLAAGVIMLGAREWWDRTRECVVAWWMGGGPPVAPGGRHGPMPPIRHA